MVSIEAANAIHLERGNAAWANITDPAHKRAALANASDFITASYRIRADVAADDARLVLATSLLALDLHVTPLALRSTAAMKSEELQLGSKKIKREFNDADADPFPLISRILAPLAPRTAPSGISFGQGAR